MLKFISRTLIVLIFLSCNTNKRFTMKCDVDEAEKIADEFMRINGHDLSLYNRTLESKDDSYLIKYSPKDTLVLGGGAEIEIAKTSCKYINYKFYQ